MSSVVSEVHLMPSPIPSSSRHGTLRSGLGFRSANVVPSRSALLWPWKTTTTTGRGPVIRWAIEKSTAPDYRLRESGTKRRNYSGLQRIERAQQATTSRKLVIRPLLVALHERIRQNQWPSALEVFDLVRSQEWYVPDPSTYLKLFAMLSTARQPAEASRLFELFLEDKLRPTTAIFTALLSIYTKTNHFRLYVQARKIFDEMVLEGVKRSIVTCSALIFEYGKTRLLRMIEHVLTMMESSNVNPDTVTWNTLIRVFGLHQRNNDRELAYDGLLSQGLKPDVVTLNSLISAYGTARLFDKVESVVGYLSSVAAFHLVRQKVNFVGRTQASSEFTLFRHLVALQSASDQGSSSIVKSVKRSVLSARLGNESLSSDSVDQGISSPKPSETQARKKNAESQQNRPSSDSWSSVPGGRPPLTADEEAEFALHVQDFLALETKRDELEEQLGRTPTHQEWADYVGISVFLLYARQGRGRAAKRKMVESNIMLVHSIAHQFHGRGLSHDDLCQQGMIGLLKSTEKFDSTRSTKFSSYAFFGVQNQMRIAAEKFGHALRIGQTVYANVSSLLRQKENFAVEHGRQPTHDELVEVSKMSAKKIRKLFQVMSPVKSLDASEANSSESSSASSLQLKDHTPTSHPWLRARDEEQKAEVIRALSSLTPHQQHIVHLRYGLGGQPPLSRAEVAMVLGVSSTAVLTSEKRALGRLRELALEEGFLNYLNDSFWLR